MLFVQNNFKYTFETEVLWKILEIYNEKYVFTMFTPTAQMPLKPSFLLKIT